MSVRIDHMTGSVVAMGRPGIIVVVRMAMSVTVRMPVIVLRLNIAGRKNDRENRRENCKTSHTFNPRLIIQPPRMTSFLGSITDNVNKKPPRSSDFLTPLLSGKVFEFAC